MQSVPPDEKLPEIEAAAAAAAREGENHARESHEPADSPVVHARTPERRKDKPAPPLLRYKAAIAYDGTLFHGWQKQEPPGGEPLRTVAGVVELAIATTLGQRITLVGASRTDAGVHARGQVAHFDAASRIPLERMAEAINSRLPPDVEIIRIEPVTPEFQAISGARCKQYRYRILNSRHKPLERRHYVYPCWFRLDVDRMRAAAARLVGTHDFAGLAAASHGRLTTVRTIYHCDVESQQPGYADEVHIVVQGSGFLYNMVRIIAGTLIEVGRGHQPPEVIDQILASGQRSLAGPTLPPNGLWLEWIEYDLDDQPVTTVPIKMADQESSDGGGLIRS